MPPSLSAEQDGLTKRQENENDVCKVGKKSKAHVGMNKCSKDILSRAMSGANQMVVR